MRATFSKIIVLGIFLVSTKIFAEQVALSPPKDGRKGSILLIGKPYKKSPNKGLIWKTMEMEINVGAFGGDHVGYKETISSESRELFQQFSNLDSEKLYIFEVEIKSYWMVEAESTHWMLKAIYPFGEYNQDLPNTIESNIGRRGSYSTDVVRTGKILAVLRWNDAFTTECAIKLSLGGISEGQHGGVNRTVFNIYNEYACQWAEQIILSGRSIDVDYSDQFWEVIEFSSKVAHKLTLRPEDSEDELIEVGHGEAVPANITSYESIREALLQDEVFLRQLIEKLEDPNLQKQDGPKPHLTRNELEQVLKQHNISLDQIESVLKKVE